MGLLRDHHLVLIFLVVSVFVLLYAASGVLGQIAYDNYYSVFVRYDDQENHISTHLTTVGDVLESLDITLGPLDAVDPVIETAINDDNFQIDVRRGRYIKIIDGEDQALEITVYEEPRVIVENLNYGLDANDVVDWHAVEPTDSLSLVPAIMIQRANDYSLNINGRVSSRKAQSTSVGDILEELGHATKNIAYIRPQLNQVIEEDNSIVVYYEKSNQEIIIETKTVYEQDKVIEQGVVYQVIYDPKTGRVLERNIIEKYTTDQSLSTSAEQYSSGEVVSSSHRVGDLNEEQKSWLRQAGIEESDWFYVDYIIFRESHWHHQIWNSQGSGAYGLCQALPAWKMSSFGADYMTNPITQLKWCDWYARERYGSWPAAYQFWLSRHWW